MVNAPSAFEPHPGIASGMNVTTDVVKSWNRTLAEKLGTRHRVVTFDIRTGQVAEKRIRQRIEHAGQTVLGLVFMPDWRVGSSEDQGPNTGHVLALSSVQEVLAADDRSGTPRWIAARDLLPGRHVLRLAESVERPWAEIREVQPTDWGGGRVHELVLEDCESFEVHGVLLRARQVPAKVVKKRVVYPLKDHPALNYVPQPRTMSEVHAEIWYRKSAALLPQCIDAALPPRERVQAALDLKEKMRNVAAKATLEKMLHDEFIRHHPLPTLEELLPAPGTAPEAALARAADEAVRRLSEPGPRRYSDFVGGAESHEVQDFGTGTWVFGPDGWVLKLPPARL
jgi:hypothetical protein